MASAADAATRARLGPPSRRSPSSWPSRMSGRRPRRSSLVRVRCPPCGRTSVQLVGRTSGVQVTGVHATGVIRGVRTDTRPVSTAAAAALSGPCWIPESVGAAGPATLAHRVGRVAVVVRGLVVAAESGLGGRDGRTSAARGSHEDRRQTWTATWYAYRLRRRARCSATMGAGPAPVPVGWRGSREGAGAPSPPQVRPGQVAGVLADHGAGPGGGDHATWSARWCWSPVVPWLEPYLAQRGVGCGRSAAAVCRERCPLGN